jgi:hypothetical protein
MVAARVDPTSVGDLKALLATMNFAPGRVNAANPLVPFEKLENLHFARFVILDDQTLDDIRLYGLPRQEYPLYLAFLCDFDGGTEAFLADLARVAGPGLRRVFSFCDSFGNDNDLLQWIRDHDLPIATKYVNWRGRTVRQVSEEVKLREALGAHLRSQADALDGQPASRIRELAQAFVASESAAGRLVLTPPEPVPLGVRIGETIRGALEFLLLVVAGVPVALMVLWIRFFLEITDPVFAPRPDPAHDQLLALQEDHEATNQFTAMGSLKPGLARKWVMGYVLWVIDWTARHIYTQGRLARVRTIHFARWVYLDGGKRVVFASNYDGSRESYMDDFINKTFFGLNVVFSNGIGYPSTRWLLTEGALDEQKFKYFLRRHQVPTDVWYNAHPSMTAVELERNGRIRLGLEAAALSEDEAREWVQLL